MAEDVQARAQALVKALKLFDDMVSALPLEVDVPERDSREDQEREEENEEVGDSWLLSWRLWQREKRRVGRLFAEVASKALN